VGSSAAGRWGERAQHLERQLLELVVDLGRILLTQLHGNGALVLEDAVLQWDRNMLNSATERHLNGTGRGGCRADMWAAPESTRLAGCRSRADIHLDCALRHVSLSRAPVHTRRQLCQT
jgi:hypothetical protein